MIGYLIHGTWGDLTTVPLLARLSNPPDKRYPDTRDDVLHDGEEVRLGRTVLVAHKTPGHPRLHHLDDESVGVASSGSVNNLSTYFEAAHAAFARSKGSDPCESNWKVRY